MRHQQLNEISYFATATTPPNIPTSSIASSASSTGDEHQKTQSGDGDEKNGSSDGAYYSFIKRKFVAPNAGAASETASFRAMVIETVKANASELHYQQQRKLYEIKERLGGSSSQRSSDVEKNGTLQTSQRIILDEPRIQRDVTAEVKASTFHEETPIIGNDKRSNKEKPLPPITPASTGDDRRLSPHIKHSKCTEKEGDCKKGNY